MHYPFLHREREGRAEMTEMVMVYDEHVMGFRLYFPIFERGMLIGESRGRRQGSPTVWEWSWSLEFVVRILTAERVST